MRIKYASFVVAVAAFVWGCSPRDPIDRLMEKVSHEGPTSYMFAPIKLPETASPQQCIADLTKSGQFRGRSGVLLKPKILEIRQVHDGFRGNITAVLLDDGEGRKIVLLQPQLGRVRDEWFYRIYDAK